MGRKRGDFRVMGWSASPLGEAEEQMSLLRLLTPFAIFVLLTFGGVFATSYLVDRVLKRKMSNVARGIFTFVVGFVAMKVLQVIILFACDIFGGECS